MARLGDRIRTEVNLYLHGTPVGERLLTLSYYADALEVDLALTQRLQQEVAGRADENADSADELFEKVADLNRALDEALEHLGEEKEADYDYVLPGQGEW